MKATKATTLLIAALIAGVAGYLTATYLVTHGYPMPSSGYNLMFTLPAIAVILGLLALPIWRYRRQTLKLAKLKTQTVSNQPPTVKRVDPFYAVRILMLAKATAVASALFIGWHLSLVFIESNKPDLTSSFFKNLVTLIGSVLALAIALVVEWICRIPDSPENLEKQTKLKANPIDPALSKELHD
ncbi:MAG: DUF3180 domain-containing protein [Micrococcales bacterium]